MFRIVLSRVIYSIVVCLLPQEFLRSPVSSLFEFLQSPVSSLFDFLRSPVSSLFEFLRLPVSSLFEFLQSLVFSLLDTLYQEKGRGREKKKEERGTLIIIPDNAKYLEREKGREREERKAREHYHELIFI